MCGYCIEGSVTLGFIESQDVELENNWVPIYLQETTDLPAMLKKTRAFDRIADAIDIAFCRLFEQFINTGFNDSFQLIEATFGQASIDGFLYKLTDCLEGEIWHNLGNHQLYKNQKFWDQFLGNRNELVEASEELLWSYYDFWLADKENLTENPATNVVSIRQKYQLKSPPPKDRDKFNHMFSQIFFALSMLAKYQPTSKALIRIALKNPEMPDFGGYDLWLQRKAFTACLKAYGFEFIAYHFKNIRFELMAYALLKGGIHYDNLSELTGLINTFGQDGVVCIGAIDLLDMIDRYKKRLSYS